MTNNRIAQELIRIARLLLGFRPKDMWKIAEEAVKFIKMEYQNGAYADEQKLPTQFGKQAGPIKLYYSDGNDYLWMIQEGDGFRIDGEQIKDNDIKFLVQKHFKSNKVYESFSEFKSDLKAFKDEEVFSTAAR